MADEAMTPAEIACLPLNQRYLAVEAATHRKQADKLREVGLDLHADIALHAAHHAEFLLAKVQRAARDA